VQRPCQVRCCPRPSLLLHPCHPQFASDSPEGSCVALCVCREPAAGPPRPSKARPSLLPDWLRPRPRLFHRCRAWQADHLLLRRLRASLVSGGRLHACRLRAGGRRRRRCRRRRRLGCTLSTAAQLPCSPQWPRQRPAPFLYSRPLPLAKTAAPPSPPPPHCRRRALANCSALSSSTKEGNPSAFHLDACGGQQRPPRPALCSLGRRGPLPGQGGGQLRRRKTRP
jgi:hypothetical protein